MAGYDHPPKPIVIVKVEAIDAIVADASLTSEQQWFRINEILQAPNWTVHHILLKQSQRPAS